MYLWGRGVSELMGATVLYSQKTMALYIFQFAIMYVIHVHIMIVILNRYENNSNT